MLRILPKVLNTQAQACCHFPMQSSIPWHRLLTRRLNARTKLVGPVISCEGAPFKGQAPSKWRDSPAVQSYAIALDQVKLLSCLNIPAGHLCWQSPAWLAARGGRLVAIHWKRKCGSGLMT